MNVNDPKKPKLLKEFPVSTHEQWREAADKLLKGAPFDKVMKRKTPEGITPEPIYRKEVLNGLSAAETLPGFDGYLRGTKATGYRSEPWEVAQELPYGTPEEFNKATLADLMAGQDALNVVLDIATLKGLDPDEAGVGEVAACGLSIASLKDVQTAFEGIEPEAVRFHFRTGCAGLTLGSLFFTWLDYQGADLKKIRGSLGMDPYAVLAAAGVLPTSLSQLFDEQLVMAHACNECAPGIRAIGVSTLPYHMAGASAVQELGIALATGAAYIQQMLDRGLTASAAASQIRFSFCIGPNFFVEIAKLRAVRVLWAQVVKAFGGDEASQKIVMHARTGLYNKTQKDPYVNMLRATTEAMSGVIGGVDSLCVGCFDEVSRITDTFSRRISRNTQVILQEECDLIAVVDPAGGSWAVEWLTDQVSRNAWTFFQEIEKAGGIEGALKSQFIYNKVVETATANEASLDQRRSSLVGTNVYPNLGEKALEGRIPDCGQLRRERAEAVVRYRSTVDASESKRVETELRKIANGRKAELVANCVAAYGFGATLGEVTKALRTKAEQAPRIQQLPSARLAHKYEALREASAAFEKRTGERPKIFLCNIGPLHCHKARADFTSGFFQPGGFQVIPSKGFDAPNEAVDALIESGAGITVICGRDPDYVEKFADFAKAIKTASPETVVILAGYPGEHEAAYREAGMDDYIFIKSNNYKLNHYYLKGLGVV